MYCRQIHDNCWFLDCCLLPSLSESTFWFACTIPIVAGIYCLTAWIPAHTLSCWTSLLRIGVAWTFTKSFNSFRQICDLLDYPLGWKREVDGIIRWAFFLTWVTFWVYCAVYILSQKGSKDIHSHQTEILQWYLATLISSFSSRAVSNYSGKKDEVSMW